MEDVLAFNKYHYSNSETFNSQKKNATIRIPIVLFLLLLILFAMIRDLRIAVWGSVFISFYLFFINRAYKNGVIKTVRKQYEEQDMKAFLCEHILEIDEQGIIEKTEMNERKDKWAGVQLIASNQDYVFIYVGAMQAHIIPRNRIAEGDLEKFLESAKLYLGKDVPAL